MTLSENFCSLSTSVSMRTPKTMAMKNPMPSNKDRILARQTKMIIPLPPTARTILHNVREKTIPLSHLLRPVDKKHAILYDHDIIPIKNVTFFLSMLTIRFSRVGKKKAPVYRIVVMPKHKDPWAPSTEILGHYNPRQKPKEFVANIERVKYWLSKGAEASDSVWNLLVEQKIVEGKKRSTTNISKRHGVKLEKKATEAKSK